VTVLVHGAAGLGTTALCRRCAEDLVTEHRALLLAGRSSPGVVAPYQALAPLVEALAAHLAALPPAEVALLMVPDLAALATLFPALRRAPAVAAAPPLLDAPDPHEVRRRASAALRALLGRLAARRPLCLWLDDLQWGDADSASLLLDSIAPPDAPPLLLLAGYTGVEAAAVDLPAALLRRMARGEPVSDVREVLVGPLSPRETRALARSVLPAEAPDAAEGAADALADAVAHASGGSPRLVLDLARAVIAAPPPPGAPLREAVAARLPARAAPATPPSPPPTVEAGDRAAAVLAFRAAASLYRAALPGTAEPGPVLVKLGDALARAGRGAEAGRAYLEAAAAAPPDEALARRRRAARELLRAGVVDEGQAALREVLAAFDLSLPASPAGALASLYYRRAHLSLRGLLPVEGPADGAEILRLDVCRSAMCDLAVIDPVRAADLHARHLLGALRAGDPGQLAHAFAAEALVAAFTGGRDGPARAEALVTRARALAGDHGDAGAVAGVAIAAAGVAFHAARFADAGSLADQAIGLLRRTCTDFAWELGALAAAWLLPALFYQGRLDDLAFRLPAYLDEAEARGALYPAAVLRTRSAPQLRMAGDHLLEARREVSEGLRAWTPRGFHAPHWGALGTRAALSLYEGEGPGAHADVEGAWPELERSSLLRIEAVRVEALALRGGAAIAAAAAGSDGEQAFRVADRARRALAREPAALARPLEAALGAALALARGQEGLAMGLYEEAERVFGSLAMGLHAAAARRRRGEIAGGDEGSSLCEGADAWMRDRGVARPDRLAAVLAPAPYGPI
jgi:tetratricopeptide (TPR) repeat protein